MQLDLKDLGKLIKATSLEWYRRDPFRQSAVIAYYAIFGIPGLMLLITTFVGYFFGKEVVVRDTLAQVARFIGADAAAQIEDIMIKAGQGRSTLLGSIIGFSILIIGASGVFVELQKSLNIIWEVQVAPKKGMGIWPVIRVRLFSFGTIIAIAFLLLVSLIFSTVLASMSDWLKVGSSVLMNEVFNMLNLVFSLAAISVLFALIFKILPDAKVEWKHVWLGAIFTGLLFTIGKTGLALYFGTAHPASAYGVAGSIVLILLWVSYSSMIVFWGAEFTAKYAKLTTGQVKPTLIAKPATPGQLRSGV